MSRNGRPYLAAVFVHGRDPEQVERHLPTTRWRELRFGPQVAYTSEGHASTVDPTESHASEPDDDRVVTLVGVNDQIGRE